MHGSQRRYSAIVAVVCTLVVRSKSLQMGAPSNTDTFFSKLSPTARNCGKAIDCEKFVTSMRMPGVLESYMNEHMVLLETLTHCCSTDEKQFAWDFFHEDGLNDRLSHRFPNQFVHLRRQIGRPSSKDLFKPLREFSKKHGNHTPVVVVLEEHDPCNILSADRAGFNNEFILVGPFAGLAGTTVGGHGIMSGGPYGNCIPSVLQTADPSGVMRVVPHTVTSDGTEILGLDSFVNTRKCEKYGMQAYLDILNDPRLKAWITHQGSFVYRSRPEDSWQSHPKIISAPLGPSKNSKVTPRGKYWGNANFPTRRSKLVSEPNFNSSSALGPLPMRTALQKQAEPLFQSMSRRFDHDDDGKSAPVQNMFEVCSSKNSDAGDPVKTAGIRKMINITTDALYAFSPPGVGADCFRHYELLLLGTLPIMLRGCGMERTFQRAHAVYVDDLSQLSQGYLEQRYQASVEDLKTRVLGQAAANHELFDDYWVSLIRDVLMGKNRLAELDHPQDPNLVQSPKPFSGADFYSYLDPEQQEQIKQGRHLIVFERRLNKQVGPFGEFSQKETFEKLKKDEEHMPWPDRT